MLTLFFAFLGLTTPAQAQLRLSPVQGQYQIRGEFDYLTTGADFEVNGGPSQSIAFGGKLTNMSGLAEVSYDFNQWLRVWAGLDGGQTTATVINQSQTLPGFSVVTQNNSNSGLNEGYLGSQWWIYVGNFSLVPQVDLVLPFWRVDETSSNPLLGDGAVRLQTGGWAMVQWGDFTPYVYGGYVYRDSGYSGLVQYNFGAHYAYQNQFWAEAGWRGFQAITDDMNGVNRIQREAFLSRVDGGSFEYYSINPSQDEGYLTVGFNFDRFGVYAGYYQTTDGRSSADGWGAVLGATFTGSLFSAPKRHSKSEPEFIENSEKFDEHIFREQSPVSAPDLEPPSEVLTPADETAPPPVRPAAKRKKKKPKTEPMPNVELLMKDTQKNLDH